MTYHEERVGNRYYEWHTCEILRCENLAGWQNASTGRLVCDDHYHELAPVPHQTGFVEIDGGNMPPEKKRDNKK